MAERPAHSLARLGNELAGQARQYARLMRLDKPVFEKLSAVVPDT